MHLKFKQLIYSFVLIFSVSEAYSQSKNSVAVVFGTASNDILRKSLGGPVYSGKGQLEFGFRYMHSFTKAFSIESGLYYSNNKIQSMSEFYPNVQRTTSTGNIQMLSIPAYANVSFLKYLFVNGGLIVDLLTNTPPDPIETNKLGIGFGLGIGGKYDFNNMTVFVNPYLEGHDVLIGGGLLGSAGVKVGFGYRF